MFVLKNVLSQEWAWVIMSLNFCHMQQFQCPSGVTVFFFNDCGVIKVNYVVKSPCMFSNVGAFSSLFCISNKFFDTNSEETRHLKCI